MSAMPTKTIGELLAEDRGISVGVMYPGEHDPEGVPLIKAGDIQDCTLNPNPDFRISPTVHHEYRRTKLEGGEILMTLVGKPGQCVLVPAYMAGWNAARAIAVIRLRESSDAPFVRYACHSPDTQHLIKAWCNTTVQPTLNLKEIRVLPIPWPSRQERSVIASILGALDDKIELNRRMNETLEDLARTIFKSWFVDFDPVRAKAEGNRPEGMDDETAALFPSRFVESELGEIPEGWAVKSLADLTTKIGSGATPRGGSSVYVDEGVSLIRSQNVYDRRFAWAGLARITDEAADALRGVTVAPDDVLINITGDSILRTCVVDPSVLPARVNQHVSIVRANKAASPRFLHEHLLLPHTKDWFLGLDTGGTRKAITKGHLESFQLAVPPLGVLRVFDVTTATLYQRTVLNTEESRALAQLRDLLLPKLISGELRVPDAEKLAEAVL